MYSAREDILSCIDQALFFRQRKATEYPNDCRNQLSVAELQRLRVYVSELPEAHDLFIKWDTAWAKVEDEAIYFFEEVLESTGERTDIFARYGFHGREDPESFCERLAARLDDFALRGEEGGTA
ncbi:hypothetical protein HH1059_14040 [Halorhodospira halochloris]|uniref:Uncharacterized protein n=1 Tax=Halorhodospira halochloris TaxID=1052 RepID=A0A0X8XAM4_HALHR|nr:hypothetical protein [Halorhodospira halochloris]MBK1652979.1 hypothetical protein [Halorhodospira halochloris]BAU58112.1 hypothetical protein HH1059_14040 [Halorhodospira halochloris]